MKNYLLIAALFISASLSAMESHERSRPRLIIGSTKLSKTAVVYCLLMALPISRAADTLPQDNRELVAYDTWLVDGLYKPLILGDEYNRDHGDMFEFKARLISETPSSGTCWVPSESTACYAYRNRRVEN